MSKRFIFLFGIFFIFQMTGKAQRYPFPAHTDYHIHIKPSRYTQDELDRQVENFYNKWKKKFLRSGCDSGQYYVYFDDGNTLTVSEAMGYGMMIEPLMAGYDPDAQKYFDGLYLYYKAHPSHIMHYLMAWKQITGCKDADGPDSAPDGDIDIAFGLLLAHAQWGSSGKINYLEAARLIINDIMGPTFRKGDINQKTFTVKLGDWATTGKYLNGTRTSDFIMDHFRSFACAVHDSSWYQVVDSSYRLVALMQSKFSPKTGLLPDFIQGVNTTSPHPAEANYLESKLDGNYSYNACRDPWRLANDYLINGDKRALKAVLKIDDWLLKSTGGNVNNVYAGYYLNGKKAVNWSDIAFTAPFAVGAMLDTTHREWLNKLYAKVLSASFFYGGYYDNTLKLLAMITLSGNYWTPPCDVISSVKKNEIATEKFRVFPTIASAKVHLTVSSPLKNGEYFIKVLNILGKTIYQKSYSYDIKNATISLVPFPTGLYLVTLSDNKGNLIGVRKIIKK